MADPYPRKGRGYRTSESELDGKLKLIDTFPIREADVQVLLAKRIGDVDELDHRCEARWPSKHHRSGEMRVDVLVFKDGWPICIVECKKAGKPPLGANTRQNKAYRDSGLPVFVCIGMEDLEKTMDCIMRTAINYGATA